MPIEFFVQDEEQPSLEFLADALEDDPKLNGKLFDVFSFKKAKSGKGYMVYTSHFIVWFFKKEKIIQQALEALDYYCKTGEGFQFVIEVDKKAKSKFHLGLDTERQVKYVPLENTSYRLVTTNDMEVTEKKTPLVNPFLIQKPNPSLPPLNTDSQNNGDSNLTAGSQGKKGREGRIQAS